MSSPLSNLKKSRKSPLQSVNFSGKKNVPYRTADYIDDESKLLDEVTADMASSRLKLQYPDPDNFHRMSPFSSDTTTQAPGNFELMTSMMTRIGKLEQQVKFQAKDILEKDRKIKILEEKTALLNKAKDAVDRSHVRELENKCFQLQKQVHQMEAFLADYGMIWVGEDDADDDALNISDVYHHDLDEEEEEDANTVPPIGEQTDSLWQPAGSRVEFKMDYDLVMKNITELNALAGDGIAKIQHTTDGARLKMPEPVQLTLYENGILMFSGPFRSFTEPSTRTCMMDFMDGYFPSELQNRFPEGVPFKVTDKRHTHFKDKRDTPAFRGAGQTLGGETIPSRLVPSNLDNTSPRKPSYRSVTSELPGPKLTVDQFLGKLPSNVVRHGQIIDIRNDLRSSIQGSAKTTSGVTVVQTDAVKDLQERLEMNENERPASSREVTTLRIKSEEGSHTYVLKMKFSDTIAAVRRHLINERPKGSPAFHIVSTFPNRTYTDDRASLKQCGLVPNATLYLKAIK